MTISGFEALEYIVSTADVIFQVSVVIGEEIKWVISCT
jgi:hypothetical protein